MKKYFKCRHAFTLIEIMISLAVILLVTALALPQVKDSLKSGTVSRSASLVQGAFRTARAMAMQKGKPFGVMIERRDNQVNIDSNNGARPDNPNVNFSARLSFVQVPASYPARTSTSEPKIYPFPNIERRKNNPAQCDRTYKYFVPRADAELLYAAAQGEAFAVQLIKPGTVIQAGERISRIEDLRVVPELKNTPFDPTSGKRVPDVALQNNPKFRQPGVIVTTDDWLLSNPASSGYGPKERLFAALDLSIQLDPIKAAMSPLNLPGRTVVDLSVSGSRENPIALGVEEIIGDRDAVNVGLHGVIVMFSPDGRLDAIYMDRLVEFNDGSTVVRWERHTPPSSLSFMVGFSQGVLGDVDDGANFPTALLPNSAVANLDYEPNFTNSDCHWVTIDGQSGRADVVPVAQQPDDVEMRSYFTAQQLSDARTIIKKRIDRSKRLSYGGVL